MIFQEARRNKKAGYILLDRAQSTSRTARCALRFSKSVTRYLQPVTIARRKNE
jgi:hypothetical protein